MSSDVSPAESPSVEALTTSVRLGCAAAVLVWLVILWAWPDAPLLMCFDDSYYYFEIADNIAAGRGSTFDRINLTNGYHPLWMAICVPVYALGFEGMTAVRVLLSIGLALWGAAWLLMADLVVRAVGVWPRREMTAADRAAVWGWLKVSLGLLMFFSLIGPMAVRAFGNGLESAPYVLLYSGLVWCASRLHGDLLTNTTAAQRWGLGLIASLAFLARTDAGLMLACLLLWQLPVVARLGAAGVLRLVQIYTLPTLTFVAFLGLNQAWFGIPLQVSGELKRMTPTPAKWAMMLAFLSIPVVVALVMRGALGAKFPRTKQLFIATGWFGVFVCCTFAYYLGMQSFPQLWYFGPAIYYAALTLFTAYLDLTDGAVDEAKPEESPVAPVRTLSLAIVGALALGAGHQTWLVYSSQLLNVCRADRDAAVWIDQNLPEETVLGCWDAGVMAYHMKQRLVNLDGLVNSVEFLNALKSRTSPAFLRDKGVTYIVNHFPVSDGQIDERHLDIARQTVGAEAVAHWQTIKEWPFTFAGGTNNDAAGLKSMAVLLLKLPADSSAPTATPTGP